MKMKILLIQLFNNIKKDIAFYIIFILSTILFFILIRNNYILGGDIEAVELSPDTWTERLRYFWLPNVGFGTTFSPQGSYSMIYSFQGFLTYLFGIIYSQKLFYYLLWILPLPIVYLIFLKISDKHILSAILAFIYLFSYPLQIANALNLPFFYINNFLILFAFYYFLKNKKGLIHLELILIYVLTTITARNQTTFILFYIYIILLFLYQYIENKNTLSFSYFVKKVALNLTIAFLINLIWFIPFLYEFISARSNYLSDIWNTKILTEGNVYWQNNGLIGFLRGFSHDFFINWTEKPTYDYAIFYHNPIWIFLSFLPIFLVIFSFILSRNSNKKSLVYLFTLFISSVFFLKGAAEPLGNIYLWALKNIPFFAIFRNPTTKFMVYYIFFLFLLLIIFLRYVKNKSILIVLLLLLFLTFNLPLLYYGNILNNRHYFDLENNSDYIETCNFINYNDDFRNIIILPLYDSTLFISKDLYEGYDLLAQCSTKSNWQLGSGFNQPINRYFYDNLKVRFYSNEHINLKDLYKYKISHIIWHKDANLKYMFGGDNKNDNLLLELKSNKNLIKEKEYKNLIIFKIIYNESLETDIYTDNITFQKVNPIKYDILIKNLKAPRDLLFFESFHDDWKLYIKNNPTNSWCGEVKYFVKNDAKECENQQKFFEGEELSYLWEKPNFDSTHKVVNEYANGWTIDPEYIKANYPKEYYKIYPDGSMDIELTLYFKPQSYFYLGIIISTLTFVGCIAYLTRGWWRKINE